MHMLWIVWSFYHAFDFSFMERGIKYYDHLEILEWSFKNFQVVLVKNLSYSSCRPSIYFDKQLLSQVNVPSKLLKSRLQHIET